MTIVLDARFEGDPRSKGRPRFTQTGRTYTPRSTQQAEEAVRWQATAAMVNQAASEDELRVTLHFDCKTLARRDIDNLCKLVLDACNGVIWADDQQIAELHATRNRGSKTPGTSIRVETL